VCPGEASLPDFGFRQILIAWAIKSFLDKGLKLEFAVEKGKQFIENQDPPEGIIEANGNDVSKVLFFNESWYRIGTGATVTERELALLMLESADYQIIPALEPEGKARDLGVKLRESEKRVILVSDNILLSPQLIFVLLEMIPRLVLSMGLAGKFIGCSPRQLCYWTDLGLIDPIEDDEKEIVEGDLRYFGFAQLVQGLVMSDARRRGIALKQASDQSIKIAPMAIAEWAKIIEESRSSSMPSQPKSGDSKSMRNLVLSSFERQIAPTYTTLTEDSICLYSGMPVKDREFMRAELARLCEESVLDRIGVGDVVRYRLLPGYEKKVGTQEQRQQQKI